MIPVLVNLVIIQVIHQVIIQVILPVIIQVIIQPISRVRTRRVGLVNRVVHPQNRPAFRLANRPVVVVLLTSDIVGIMTVLTVRRVPILLV